MNFDFEALLLRLRTHMVAAVIGGVGILCILAGTLTLLLSNKDQGIIFDSAGEEVSTSASVSARLFVDVSGAVIHPGVYKLLTTARVQDALIAAGGLAAFADRDWIAKNLNLANKLSDGGKVYIPSKPIQTSNSTFIRESSSENSQMATSSDSHMVNINTASLSELDKLPGIGPVTAGKIIDNRPYADAKDLLSKKVLGQKIFDQIKNSISVY